jgi:hypothetical protein
VKMSDQAFEKATEQIQAPLPTHAAAETREELKQEDPELAKQVDIDEVLRTEDDEDDEDEDEDEVEDLGVDDEEDEEDFIGEDDNIDDDEDDDSTTGEENL